MTTSKTPDDAPSAMREAAAPAVREWVKPVLIEYGHLAKLTRGGSGLITETGGKKMNCL